MEITEKDLDDLLEAATAFKAVARSRLENNNPRAIFQIDAHFLPMIAFIIESYVADRRNA